MRRGTTLRITVLAVVVAVLCGIAVWRVWPYVTNPRKPPPDPRLKAILHQIENEVTPEYDFEPLRADAGVVHGELIEAARRSLLALPAGERPSPAAAARIAEAFADMVILYRTQDHLAYIDWAAGRGRTVPPNYLNPEQADPAWRSVTAWARHAPLDAGTIEARTQFLRGEAAPPDAFASGSSGGPSRMLRSGGSLFGEHGHTVYSVSIRAIAPTPDGRSTTHARYHLHIVNDGPNGGWDPMHWMASDVPEGVPCFLPPA